MPFRITIGCAAGWRRTNVELSASRATHAAMAAGQSIFAAIRRLAVPTSRAGEPPGWLPLEYPGRLEAVPDPIAIRRPAAACRALDYVCSDTGSFR